MSNNFVYWSCQSATNQDYIIKIALLSTVFDLSSEGKFKKHLIGKVHISCNICQLFILRHWNTCKLFYGRQNTEILVKSWHTTTERFNNWNAIYNKWHEKNEIYRDIIFCIASLINVFKKYNIIFKKESLKSKVSKHSS